MSPLGRGVAVLALLLVAALAGPVRADQVNWNQRGNDAVRRGNLAQAIVDFTRATEQIPNDPVAWYNRALVYSRLGKNGEALADAQRSVSVNPLFDEGSALVSRLQRELGEYDAALASIERALAVRSGEVSYHVTRADLLRLLHRTPGALAEYEDALRRDARSAAALHGLAEVRLEQQRDGEALALLKRYVAVAPDDPDVNVVVAGLLAKTGRPQDALAWIAGHPSADPRMTDYNVRALLMLGRTGAAVAALPASARGESPYRASLRAEIAFRAGRCREAADAYRAAASAPLPDAPPGADALAWRNAGAASACAKDYEAAVAELTRAIDLNPRDPLARRYRADAHRALGSRLAAIEDARAALALGGPEANLLMMLGIDEYLAGSRAAGKHDYERGCALLDSAQTEKRELCTAQLAKMKG
jgi:tetratricopeptide (TPR) repeat protein